MEFGRFHFAAQQRSEAELEFDRGGPHLRLPSGLADFDVAQFNARARQDARGDGAVDADIEADEAARLLLER